MKDELSRCNGYMFKKAKCHRYMKKVNDGRCITMLSGEETETGRPCYFYTDNSADKESDRMIEVPVEDWGGGGFIKTYYERHQKEFVGIIIGLKMITVRAELFCDTDYGYDGSERDYVGKNIVESMKVAVVAYGCNKTRFVPLEHLEIIEQEG